MDSTPAPISHHLLASDHRGSGGEREMERADSDVYSTGSYLIRNLMEP